jgi:orotate phosphoribosyltransferase
VTGELSSGLPVREGHFLLESGYHTNLWLTLDSLFVDHRNIAPRIQKLADRIRPHGVAGVCGPLLGGAFVAQSLASMLGVAFLYTERVRSNDDANRGLFAAAYDLPPALRERARGRPVAVVDDVISAGSSVRATVAALSESGASVPVVASFLVLGDVARGHFEARAIPLVSLEERDFDLWTPTDCPLCREGAPLEDPRETSSSGRAKGPRELVEEFYSEIWNRHDESRIAALLTEDATFRGSLGPSLVGRDAFAGYVDSIHAALGSYRCTIVDVVVDGDKAFARMRFSGFHRGALLGHAPTGKPVEWMGAAMFTFRQGKIADLWVLGDLHGLMRLLEQQSG